MSFGQVNLSELYKFDELYWIPSDKAEFTVNHLESKTEMPEKELQATPEQPKIVINYPIISTNWVVIGEIPEQEKKILKLAFSAAPLGLTDSDWSVLSLEEIPESFHDFIQNTKAKKYIFLGSFAEHLKVKFPSPEFLEVLDSKVLIFPRLISSLTESEKHLKLAFWNHLKSLV